MKKEKKPAVNVNPLGTVPVGPLLRKFAILNIVAMLVGTLYNIADQIFIGHSIGELGNAAVLLFGSGLILCVITQIFMNQLLIFFGSPDNVFGYAREYVRITSLGFPFLILTTGGAHLVRVDGSPSYSMMCNFTGAIINSILDPLLIFGLGLGMTGAALATITGQIVSCLMVVHYLCRYKAGPLTKEHLIPRLHWNCPGHAAHCQL